MTALFGRRLNLTPARAQAKLAATTGSSSSGGAGSSDALTRQMQDLLKNLPKTIMPDKPTRPIPAIIGPGLTRFALLQNQPGRQKSGLSSLILTNRLGRPGAGTLGGGAPTNQPG